MINVQTMYETALYLHQRLLDHKIHFVKSEEKFNAAWQAAIEETKAHISPWIAEQIDWTFPRSEKDRIDRRAPDGTILDDGYGV